MKLKYIVLLAFVLFGCETKQNQMNRIIFLHHSTGQRIWVGKTNRYVYKLTKRGDVKSYFNKYNKQNGTSFSIKERAFPSKSLYGWKNYPYDYYNIWVKNAGGDTFMNEPTLEILSKDYDIIIFKHCYPGSNILEDTGSPNIDSEEKKLENYKLQYRALKRKMNEFPDNKFIVWTPAVHVKHKITPEQAQRTRDFYHWIIDDWDEKGDNIFIWDFYNYETEGGLYLLDKYAEDIDNSHPNKQFAGGLAPLFAQFIIDVASGTAK